MVWVELLQTENIVNPAAAPSSHDILILGGIRLTNLLVYASDPQVC